MKPALSLVNTKHLVYLQLEKSNIEMMKGA